MDAYANKRARYHDRSEPGPDRAKPGSSSKTKQTTLSLPAITSFDFIFTAASAPTLITTSSSSTSHPIFSTTSPQQLAPPPSLRPIKNTHDLLTAIAHYPDVRNHILSLWSGEPYFLIRLHSEIAHIQDLLTLVCLDFTAPHPTTNLRPRTTELVAAWTRVCDLVYAVPTAWAVIKVVEVITSSVDGFFAHWNEPSCRCQYVPDRAVEARSLFDIVFGNILRPLLRRYPLLSFPQRTHVLDLLLHTPSLSSRYLTYHMGDQYSSMTHPLLLLGARYIHHYPPQDPDEEEWIDHPECWWILPWASMRNGVALEGPRRRSVQGRMITVRAAYKMLELLRPEEGWDGEGHGCAWVT